MRMARIIVPIFLAGVIAAGCSSAKSKRQGAGGTEGAVDPSNAAPSPEPSASLSPSPTPATEADAVLSSDFVSLGVGKQLHADGTSLTGLLVGVGADGSLKPMSLSLSLDSSVGTSVGRVASHIAADGAVGGDYEIKCLKADEEGGGLVAVVRGRTPAIDDAMKTDLIYIMGDGSVHSLFADSAAAAAAVGQRVRTSISHCWGDIQFAKPSSLYALSEENGGIWFFDLAPFSAAGGNVGALSNGTMIAKPSSGKKMSEFVALDNGQIFFDLLDGTDLSSYWLEGVSDTVRDLEFPNFRAANGVSLGGYGLSFLDQLYTGFGFYSHQNDSVSRSFIEPLYFGLGDVGTGTYWPEGSQPVRVGNWIATGHLALNTLTRAVASNPFWRQHGGGDDGMQGLVDAEQQLYFDGSNVVKVSYEDQPGTVHVTLHKNILYDVNNLWKVKAVFGPAQGFAKGVAQGSNENWVGFTDHQNWIEIDPATGVIDEDNIYQMLGTSSSWAGLVPYRISRGDGTFKIVALGTTAGTGLVELIFNEGAKTVALGAAKGAAGTHSPHLALIQGTKLYFTASFYQTAPAPGYATKVYSYDALTDVATTHANSLNVDATIVPTLKTTGCGGAFFYGVMMLPGKTSPSLVFCGNDSKINIAQFSDFNFSTLSNTYQTSVDGPALGDEGGMQILPLGLNNLGIGLASQQEVRITDLTTNEIRPSVAFTKLDLEGRFQFDDIFGHAPGIDGRADKVNAKAAWDDERLLVSDALEGEDFASYLVKLSTHDVTAVSALSGLDVSVSVRLGADKVLVSAINHQSLNTARSIILSNSAALIDQKSVDILLQSAVSLKRQ